MDWKNLEYRCKISCTTFQLTSGREKSVHIWKLTLPCCSNLNANPSFLGFLSIFNLMINMLLGDFVRTCWRTHALHCPSLKTWWVNFKLIEAGFIITANNKRKVQHVKYWCTQENSHFDLLTFNLRWKYDWVISDTPARKTNVRHLFLAVHRQLNRWPCHSLITHWSLTDTPFDFDIKEQS